MAWLELCEVGSETRGDAIAGLGNARSRDQEYFMPFLSGIGNVFTKSVA